MGQLSLGTEMVMGMHKHTYIYKHLYKRERTEHLFHLKKKLGGEARLVSNGKLKLLPHIFISFDYRNRKKWALSGSLEHYHCRWLDNLRGNKRSVELELRSVFFFFFSSLSGSVVNFEIRGS